jgi:hypothetical protein
MVRDDEDDDWEDPEPDEGDDESAELRDCPACGKAIYEEAEQCPYCGEYVTHSTSPLAGRSWWFVVLGVLGIIATILVLANAW